MRIQGIQQNTISRRPDNTSYHVRSALLLLHAHGDMHTPLTRRLRGMLHRCPPWAVTAVHSADCDY